VADGNDEKLVMACSTPGRPHNVLRMKALKIFEAGFLPEAVTLILQTARSKVQGEGQAQQGLGQAKA